MDVVYELGHEDTGYSAGWRLRALHDGRAGWSIPLVGRGAAATATPRVTQAVALRVLHDQGVAVSGWRSDDRGGTPGLSGACR